MTAKTYDELHALITQRGVHAEFGEPGEGFAIEQNPHELATFLVRMQELGVTSCLEIGTGYKAGLSRFLAADMGWQVTSVDITNYHHVFEGVHYVVLAPPHYFIEFLDNQFDLLFIDGNHSFESIERDYKQYQNVVKKVIAFHDIAGDRDCEGANDFWIELSCDVLARGRDHEITADNCPAGIGWIEL